MVKSRIARLAGLLVVAAACAVAVPATATAGGGPIDGPSSSSAEGDPQYGSTGNCSVYANSSSYGLNCGAGGGQAQTVLEMLGGHNDPPTCWDTPISNDDAKTLYNLDPIDDVQFYQITCVTGLDVTKPIFDQPGLKIKQPPPIPVKKRAPACTPPFSYDQQNGFTIDCVMTQHERRHDEVPDHAVRQGHQARHHL